MASRDCAIMGVLLLMSLCVVSAHRLFLKTTEESTAPSTAPVKHNQAIHESTTGLYENPAGESTDVDHQTTHSLEKLAHKPLSRILPFGEEPSYEPLLAELAHKPLYGALAQGEEPSNAPAEKELGSTFSASVGIHGIKAYTQTPTVNTNAIQEEDFLGDLITIESYEPAPPDSAPVIEEADLSGYFTNTDPEFN